MTAFEAPAVRALTGLVQVMDVAVGFAAARLLHVPWQAHDPSPAGAMAPVT
jgi:hypothetical protein